MGYRKKALPEADSGLTSPKHSETLNKVLDGNSRVVKRKTPALGLRVDKPKKDSEEGDEEEEEEVGGGEEEVVEVKLKPPPKRPGADPWVKGADRQIIPGIEHPGVGNLCYVNAALQALAGTSYPEWVDITTKAEYLDNPKKADLAKRIRKIFKHLSRFTKRKYKQRATILTPTTTQLSLPDLGLAQHCATELIVRLDDRIIGNMNVDGYKSRLEVEILARRNCLECGNVWTQPEQFPTLQLHKPLKKQASLTQTLDWHRRIEYWMTRGCKRCRSLAIRKILRRALKNSTRDGTSAANVKIIRDRIKFLEQTLQNHTYNNLTDAEEQSVGLERIAPSPVRPMQTAEMTNEHFKTLKDAYDQEVRRRTIDYDSEWSQTQAITKLPEILLLEYVNVPGYDHRGSAIKLKSRVTFDPSMDFTEYVAGPNRNVDVGGFNLPLRVSGDSSNPAVPIYELRAILVHQGTNFTAGHWYCYRREWKDPTNPLSEQWWYCNEGTTLRVSKQDIFSGRREDPKSPRPGEMYALIYERVPDGGVVPGKTGDEGKTTKWGEASDRLV
ncbi:hypothetical protein TWF506_010315 [Arthrobotrys conoides]|uniref:ubiquitinyl hydrolase 1 n=1 Tax=Arthrobotrys conoides TaxID=74498 RepID=A0AAN8RPL1_9PEZI